MKKLFLLTGLFLFCMIRIGYAAEKQVLITWTNNSEADLAGYELFLTIGNEPETVQDVPYTNNDVSPVSITKTIIVPDNSTTDVCAQVLAYDTSGNRSARGNQACATIDLEPPAPPSGIDILVQMIVAWFKKIIAFFA